MDSPHSILDLEARPGLEQHSHRNNGQHLASTSSAARQHNSLLPPWNGSRDRKETGAPCRLLDLPPELLLNILSWLYLDPTTCHLAVAGDNDTRIFLDRASGINNLHRTCRLLYHEALPLLYQATTFTFTISYFPEEHTPKNLQRLQNETLFVSRLRRWSIVISPTRYQDQTPILRNLRSCLGVLKSQHCSVPPTEIVLASHPEMLDETLLIFLSAADQERMGPQLKRRDRSRYVSKRAFTDARQRRRKAIRGDFEAMRGYGTRIGSDVEWSAVLPTGWSFAGWDGWRFQGEGCQT